MVMSVQVLSMMLGVVVCCGACHYPAGTLSAAAVKESATIQIQAPHNATYARQLVQGGRYSISGTAWLQDKQGKRVSCAGAKVHLYAATPYLMDYYKQSGMLDERSQLYISTFDPQILVMKPHIKVQPYIQEAFFPLQKFTTTCKKDGSFHIRQVGAGHYFIRATILQPLDSSSNVREVNLTRCITVNNRPLRGVQLHHQLR